MNIIIITHDKFNSLEWNPRSKSKKSPATEVGESRKWRRLRDELSLTGFGAEGASQSPAVESPEVTGTSAISYIYIYIYLLKIFF